MVEAISSQISTHELIEPTQPLSQQTSILDGPEPARPRDQILEYDPVWRATFPNRNTFTFASGVKITSEFESGNLWKCQEFQPGEEEIIPEE